MPEADQSSSGDNGDSIKVLVRTRPPPSGIDEDLDSAACLKLDSTKNTVTMLSRTDPKVFTFDNVVDAKSAQENIFSLVGKGTVENAVDGYNGTIFAYGQTGSGKTFTMIGPSEESTDNFHSPFRGVIPRSFEYLFNLMNRKRETHGSEFHFMCRCSFLEIYNENVYDLLDPGAHVLHLREDMKRGVFVEGITEIVADSAADAYQVLTNGWVNRRVAATSMNRESSRSHAVFTVQIESKRKNTEGVQKVKMSQLHMVDLAGSERQKDTQASGQRLKEAGKINQSLSVLGHVIMALGNVAHGKKRYIPYRDSKLTFLLRNSLGGNAKTYIIACIHSGARCFGETLSTLQFVKRAKLIKNKAVMNEDAQGSIIDLQAEIKRLKCTISQMMNAPSVPRSLTDNADGKTHAHSIKSDGEPATKVRFVENSERELEWKQKFLQAMYLHELLSQERNDVAEKVTKLEELNNKKEKFLQSTKMVVKFRENHIARLEKKVKDSCSDEEVKLLIEGINGDLKSEITILREQLDHNPVVKQYAMNNQSLRKEIKKLRSQENIASQLQANEQKCRELETDYAELMSQNTGNRAPVLNNDVSSVGSDGVAGRRSITPQSESALAVATMEKFKSQLSSLQLQLDTAKEEQQEEKNVWEKTKLDLESELSTQKWAQQELEKVLEAHHIKSRLERDVMNDMHMQTIKTITTPTKSYSLRNRDVPKAIGDPIDFNLSGCDDDLMAEKEPDHVTEQAYEALTEEIRTLQEKNGELTESCDVMQATIRQLKQTNTKLEHQTKQMDEMIVHERQESSRLQQELRSQLDSATSAVCKLTEENNLLTGELYDRRLMSDSIDKELRTKREKLLSETQKYEHNLNELQANVIRMETELVQLQRQFDQSCEEKQILQDSLDTANATLSFREDRLSEVETSLAGEKNRTALLETEFQLIRDKLEEQKEMNKLLSEEMQQQGQDKEQTVLRLVVENNAHMEHLTSLQSELETVTSSMTSLLHQKEALDVELVVLKRELGENKEAINSLLLNIQSQKASIEVQNQDIEDLLGQLDERNASISEMTSSNDELRQQMETMTSRLELMTSKWEETVIMHQTEVARLLADKDHVQETCSKLEMEFVDSQIQLEIQQDKDEAKSEQLSLLQDEMKRLRQELDEANQMYSRQLAEREQGSLAVTEDLQYLVKQQAEEICNFKNKQQQMNTLLTDLEDRRRGKNDEIQHLRQELLAAVTERERQEEENVHLRTSLQNIDVEHRLRMERDDTLSVQVTDLKSRNNQLDSNIRDYVERLAEEDVRRMELQIRLEKSDFKLAMAEQLAEEKVEDVERLQKLAGRDHEERTRLQSIISEEDEYKNRMKKNLNDLTDSNERLLQENTRLIGHQNLNQKIQYHYNMKQENIKLKEENHKLTVELQRWRPRKKIESVVLKENSGSR